jgi:hypothetical protein
LRKALGIIETFVITDADAGIIKLIEKRPEDKAFAKDAFETLAILSTTAGTDFLWKEAVDGSKQAQEALGKLTPEAAERTLLPQIRSDKHVNVTIANRALSRVFDLNPVKPDKWWERTKEKAREDEIKRITQAVADQTARWRDTLGRIR